MSGWEAEVFEVESNIDLLDELADLDSESIVEEVSDLVRIAAEQGAQAEEQDNAQLAATLLAIWAGAPFSDRELAQDYPFILGLRGRGEEDIREIAAGLLEQVESDEDLDAYIEALS
ncbi:DUF4259 domain-containing protein [Corynebacterium pseudopelargi]|uniref:DUF4259 domain-containing protein n=1 Tax=Corynebacterium pseudopelargi TaxID=2080757 RepID=A0A3G6IVY3_9CORY|nr:DUF4259 domain-containing protein [Corynebacterium pseudopelargi]AZA09826.1 hypothetical protein CPPEL_08615 [Corynebacterium pseudopelargi]